MSTPSDPVNPCPGLPLIHSYSYHSALPLEDVMTVKEDGESVKETWIMGIDEAGRGPAYCPKSFQVELEELGFDDSKALSPETRDRLWNAFTEYPNLCYSSNILSPQDISKHMLKRVPFNLNRQAEPAKCFVGIDDRFDTGYAEARGEHHGHALGPAPAWEAKLSEIFPELTFTVRPKADSLYKVVSAASIIAKVTRDRIIENWIHPESPRLPMCLKAVPVQAASKEKGKKKAVGRNGKGKGAKKAAAVDAVGMDDEEAQEPVRKRRKLQEFDSETLTEEAESLGVETPIEKDGDELHVMMVEERGSGYPSDPKTQAYLRAAFDPIFGYPSIVRFSWGTVKIAMDKNGVPCTWIDDPILTNRMKFFDSAHDQGKPKMWKEIGLASVGEL
ncbi:hypothetical protein QFC24_002896 [Naganishia onofrii]|uniref:Uncharacterized protein n=1 Tax=Naganishia onofrii TaxID=1851511 RepID=A0ACC2XNL6_9TREE|nr:hypothetical protein QFC24_002896 [Naganishia onofrii]